MQVKAKQKVAMWDGQVGDVIEVFGSQARVQLESGKRILASFDQIVEACDTITPMAAKVIVGQRKLLAHKVKTGGIITQADFEKLSKGNVDETKWDKAKKVVEKQKGTVEDSWALVNHIYQNMGGKFSSTIETAIEAGKIPGVPDGTGPHGLGKEKGRGDGMFDRKRLPEQSILNIPKEDLEDNENRFAEKEKKDAKKAAIGDNYNPSEPVMEINREPLTGEDNKKAEDAYNLTPNEWYEIYGVEADYYEWREKFMAATGLQDVSVYGGFDEAAVNTNYGPKHIPDVAGWYVYDSETGEVIEEGIQGSENAAKKVDELYTAFINDPANKEDIPHDFSKGYTEPHNTGWDGVAAGILYRKAYRHIAASFELADTVRITGNDEHYNGKEGIIVDKDTERDPFNPGGNKWTLIFKIEGEGIDPNADESWVSEYNIEKISAKTAGLPNELGTKYAVADMLVLKDSKDVATKMLVILDVNDKDYIVEDRPIVEGTPDSAEDNYGVRFNIPISKLDKDKNLVRYSSKKLTGVQGFTNRYDFANDTNIEQDVFVIQYPDIVDSKELHYDWSPEDINTIKSLKNMGGNVRGALQYLYNILNSGINKASSLEFNATLQDVTASDDSIMLSFADFDATYDTEGELLSATDIEGNDVPEKVFSSAYRKEFGKLVKTCGVDQIVTAVTDLLEMPDQAQVQDNLDGLNVSDVQEMTAELDEELARGVITQEDYNDEVAMLTNTAASKKTANAELDIDKITYGDSTQDSAQSYGQDILYDGEIIGALVTRQQGMLEPLLEYHQLLGKDTDANISLADSWSDSEDEGYIFLRWNSLEDFVKNYSKVDKYTTAASKKTAGAVEQELETLGYDPSAAQKTQRDTNYVYDMASALVSSGELQAPVLDFGGGKGQGTEFMSQVGHETSLYEKYPTDKTKENFGEDIDEMPEGQYPTVINSYVLNVVPPETRDIILSDIRDKIAPGGSALIGARGFNEIRKEIKEADEKGKTNFHTLTSEENSYLSGQGTFQHGFTADELSDLVSGALPGFKVEIVSNTPPVVLAKSGTQASKKRVASLLKKAKRLGNYDFDNHDKIWEVEAGEEGASTIVKR